MTVRTSAGNRVRRAVVDALEGRRLLAAAALDATFGTAGLATVDVPGPGMDEARAGLVVQADGKVVVAGTTEAVPPAAWPAAVPTAAARQAFAVARFNADGTLDATFGTGGEVVAHFGDGTRSDAAYALALGPGGTIVVAGTSSPAADPNFADAEVAVLRLNADGSPDRTFNRTGQVLLDLGTAAAPTTQVADGVAVLPDGRVAVVGWAAAAAAAGASGPAGATRGLVVRLRPDGSLDPTFGTGGVVTESTAGGSERALAVAADASGRLVVAGGRSTPAGTTVDWDATLTRYAATGARDATFATGGRATAQGIDPAQFGGVSDDAFTSLAVRPDGRIVVGGIAATVGTTAAAGVGLPDGGAAVVQFSAAGQLDAAFGDGGHASSNEGGTRTDVALDAAGDVLVTAGSPFGPDPTYTDFDVERFSPAGQDDGTFVPTGDVGVYAGDGFGVAPGPNGTVLVATRGVRQGNSDDFTVRRFTNVAADPTFGSDVDHRGFAVAGFDPPANDAAAAVAVQADGKLLVAGFGTDYPDFTRGTLARLNRDGTVDATFGTSGTVANNDGDAEQFTAVAVGSDGKVVAVGYCVPANGPYAGPNWGDWVVARYNADGTPDPTFGPDGTGTVEVVPGTSRHAAGRPAAVAVGADGSVTVAGAGDDPNGHVEMAVGRFTNAGVLDATFGAAKTGWVVTAVPSGNAGAQAMSIRGDGTILVAGGEVDVPDFGFPSTTDTSAFVLAEYDATGRPVAAFGTGGVVVTPVPGGYGRATALAVTPDGRIVLAGRSGAYDDVDLGARVDVARYASTGVLDAAFGTGGLATLAIPNGAAAARGVVVSANGAVTVAGLGLDPTLKRGTDLLVARFNSAGAADASFNGGSAYALTDVAGGDDGAAAMAALPNGRWVVAGTANVPGRGTDLVVARFAGDAVPTAVAGANVTISQSGDTLRVVAGGQTTTYPAANVSSFAVTGTTGADTLTLSTALPVPVTFAGGLGADTVIVDGGTFAVPADASATTANLTVYLRSAGAAVAFGSTQHLARLTMTAGTAATVTPGGGAVLVVGALSVATGATLSLGANAAIVRSGNLAAVTAAAGTGTVTGTPAVGVATAGSLGRTSFDGQAVATGDVLVAATRFGDADLSGVVDGQDYGRVDAGYASQSTANKLTGWANGDFNYDGKVDGSDYTLIDNAFNLQPARAAATASAVPTGSTAAVAGPAAAVAEPRPVGPGVVKARVPFAPAAPITVAAAGTSAAPSPSVAASLLGDSTAVPDRDRLRREADPLPVA